jgi:hypothetical protein
MPVIITSNDVTPGVRTFRMQSDSDLSTWYIVKRIRRPPSVHGPVVRNRWVCACNDFMNRRILDNTHCKHIKRIRAYAQSVGGVSHIPRGQTLEIPDRTPTTKLKIIRKG